MADIEWDDAALYDLLQSTDGPVGRWLTKKVSELTSVVAASAPIQKPQNYSWGKRSSSYMPRSMGYLKGSVRPHMGYTKDGMLFGGTNAAYGPTLFLEKPADQLHHRIPFMSAPLYAITIE
jgi:hypothetical protein